MGLFDFLKKKKTDADTAVETAQAPEASKEQPAESTEGADVNNSAE
ncbi:MAG: hypothetical protein UT66_C0018G0028 [candidate division CPR2 bacterium GW2011_GWC1_39_9]|uniref:Uncharacterized protein n=1 Tax=candidate division CPR2 bacterium GW2011_GWC2_39_10 TaxID=1618345 RepID=A0A0G0P740_UNCC2|nr:MAG: hypothetical protein UT18_C0013G0006 [candidate division CPR2 bacterium GW2011_GWC2_39_10]KKR34689.1 MAG: hypothetical protein UT66_C0018G0028 [candidate division CPR2 bacterium GW2011_GWC1_39_9]